MSERQVRRLPVVDRDKRLVGIVALGDFAVESSEISRPSVRQRTDRDPPGEANDDSNEQRFKEEFTMAKCDACGNDYDKSFQVVARGKTHTFDSFECAIHTLAPTCARCGMRIIGHGLEKSGRMFCCDHCAEQAGVKELRDRA